MAGVTHVFSFGWRNGSANPLNPSVSVNADAEVNVVNTVINANTTNTEIDVTIPFASIKGLFMYSDVDMTVHTNNTTGAQTFDLTGGSPITWYTGSGLDNPVNTDVTALFVDCPGAVNGHFDLRCALDVTP